MKKIIILLLCFELLAACSSENQKNRPTYPKYNIPHSVDKIINGLEGCKKEFVFEVMGLPSSEKIIDEKKYFEWNFRKAACIISAEIGEDGIINNIYYHQERGACEHAYVQIVQYYRTRPAQSPEMCPNRTDLQGNHSIKK